jgi:propionyl-CoA carboxylase alpha chain/3-methylcrotonyl-CoA carboxylase alpha subunit
MPGKIVAAPAAAGDAVAKGAPIIVLEAMKMEHALVAPADGEVAEITAEVGSQVAEGARLIVLKSEG